jgi:hypothetical protein
MNGAERFHLSSTTSVDKLVGTHLISHNDMKVMTFSCTSYDSSTKSVDRSRLNTARWGLVCRILRENVESSPSQRLAIIWRRTRSSSRNRSSAACITNIRSRPHWTDRVFAHHSGPSDPTAFSDTFDNGALQKVARAIEHGTKMPGQKTRHLRQLRRIPAIVGALLAQTASHLRLRRCNL